MASSKHYSFCAIACLLSFVSVFNLATTSCNDPTRPLHSLRSVEGLTPGDLVKFACERGYELHTGGDEVVLQCQSDGNWNGSAPACHMVTCEVPTAIAHSTQEGTSYNYGDTVTFRCHDGYKTSSLVKQSHVTCDITGNWDKDPEPCLPIQCIPPETVPHANHTEGDFFFGDTVYYSCEDGYERRKGDLNLTCGSDNFWIGKWLVCTRVKCLDPGSIPHSGRYITGLGSYDWVQYTCIRGYEADPYGGALNRTCTDNGTWSGEQPACVGKYCGPPRVVEHATYWPSPVQYRYPDSLKYTCDAGYRPDYTAGINEITCTWDGRWDYAPMNCTRVRCSETVYAQNAYVTTTAQAYYFDDVKTYICMTGHVLRSGNLERTCQANASYSGEAPICERATCGDPGEDPHANRTFSGAQFRDVATYRCHVGYEVQGEVNLVSRIIVCGSDGRWTMPKPTCIRVSCGRADTGPGTELVSDGGQYYDDVITFSCSYGYVPESGNMTRVCQFNKRWSGSTGLCTRRSCGAPASVPYTTTMGATYRYESMVFYSCQLGYKQLTGGDRIVCTANGTWEGTPMTCEPITCIAPSNISHGNWETTGYKYGDVITYTCDRGYEWLNTSGPLIRRCEHNTMWSGKRPVCEPISCGDPGPADGTYKLGISYRYTDIVNYTCKTGYEARRGRQWSVIDCDIDGVWQGQKPECIRVYCGDPGSGNNTDRNYTGFQYGDTIYYTCHDGFRVPSGIYRIKCMDTKKWSFPPPDCVVVPDIPESAKVDKDPGPPKEADGSADIGYLGAGLVFAEVGVMLLLDLTTIGKDLWLLKKNLMHVVKKIKRKIRQHRAKVATEQVVITKKKVMVKRRKRKPRTLSEGADGPVAMTDLYVE